MRRADNLSNVMKSGSLKLQVPSGTVQASTVLTACIILRSASDSSVFEKSD